MNTIKYLILALSTILTSAACIHCIEDDYESNCDQAILISADEYENAPNGFLNISSLEIDGDCLLINFSSSGCSGSSWIIQLIDADVILESYPVQRNLRLSLKNDEACAAVITKEISFDISELQLSGENPIKLNLVNSGDQILYEY